MSWKSFVRPVRIFFVCVVVLLSLCETVFSFQLVLWFADVAAHLNVFFIYICVFKVTIHLLRIVEPVEFPCIIVGRSCCSPERNVFVVVESGSVCFWSCSQVKCRRSFALIGELTGILLIVVLYAKTRAFCVTFVLCSTLTTKKTMHARSCPYG